MSVKKAVRVGKEIGTHSPHSAHGAPIDRLRARFGFLDELPTPAPSTPPRASTEANPPAVSASDLPPDLYEHWQERAAIRQFDAGFPVKEAEALALADVLGHADPRADNGNAIAEATAPAFRATLFAVDGHGPYRRGF